MQLVLLRLYVRRLKGRGTPFLTMCDARGNVWIAAIGDAPGTARPDPLAFTPSKAFQVAMGCVSPSGMGLEIARLAGYVLRAGLPCAGGLQGQGTDVPLPLPDT